MGNFKVGFVVDVHSDVNAINAVGDLACLLRDDDCMNAVGDGLMLRWKMEYRF